MATSLQTPTTSASPSVLAGGGGADSGAPASSGQPDPGAAGSTPDSGGAQSALKETIQKLRSAEMDMTELAQRFPVAAQALRQATTSIRAALRAIISNPGQPEPKAPPIGG